MGENQNFREIAMYEAAERKARRGNENLIELPSDDGPSPSPTGTVFDPFPGPNINSQHGCIRLLRLVFSSLQTSVLSHFIYLKSLVNLQESQR